MTDENPDYMTVLPHIQGGYLVARMRYSTQTESYEVLADHYHVRVKQRSIAERLAAQIAKNNHLEVRCAHTH